MANPVCSNDCTGNLPVTKFSKCNPSIHLSEIRRIFIAKAIAALFTDWKLATEWTARVSATEIADDDAIRALTVIADKPAAAGRYKDVSNGRRILLGKDHTLNYTIDDVTPENYEFMRTLECSGVAKIWYETEGGFLYGGNSGILATLTGDDILNRGRDEIETIGGIISWSGKFSPERALSPIYDSEYSIVEV